MVPFKGSPGTVCRTLEVGTGGQEAGLLWKGRTSRSEINCGADCLGRPGLCVTHTSQTEGLRMEGVSVGRGPEDWERRVRVVGASGPRPTPLLKVPRRSSIKHPQMT